METDFEEFGKISVITDHEITWTIENFSSYTKKDVSYFSQKFSISSEDWYLEICPNGDASHKNGGWISLYLYRDVVAESVSPVGASFTFGLIKVNGKIEQVLPELTWVFQSDVGYGYPWFLRRSELRQKSSELTPSDTLTLTCTLWTAEHMESSNLHNLSQDLVDMYISKKGCDVTLKVKEEEFPAHMCILSARSSIFASMFEVDIKERRMGTMKIEDCDPKAFREFLLYIYSGKISKFSSNMFEVYKIADKFNMGDLRSYCLMSILLNLTVENVLDAITFGHQFNIQGIKHKTQNFFNENFKKILLTNKWKVFLNENSSVANQLLEGMVQEMDREK